VTFNWDYNRDRRVDSRDWMVARANHTTQQTALKLITVPAARTESAGAPVSVRAAVSTGAPRAAAAPAASRARRAADELFGE
jgi:hypothetical protein